MKVGEAETLAKAETEAGWTDAEAGMIDVEVEAGWIYVEVEAEAGAGARAEQAGAELRTG